MSLLSLTAPVVSRFRPSVLLAFLAFATLASCDKVPLTAPTDSTVLLVVSTTVVPVNGTADVIASVIEKAGTAVQNGTIVTFTSSFGTVEPRDARTDASGKAYAKFIGSSQSGVAKIGAFSGAAKATEVEIKVGGAAAENIAVRAEPATVSALGGTVQIVAVVTDASGNPLPGAPVVFSADNGSLQNNTVTTDQAGQAQTALTTNRETVVRGTVAAKTANVTVRLVTPPTATITATPPNGVVGVPISFLVTPGAAAGGTILTNVVVDFGDGSPQLSLGAITGATGFTHAYNNEGGFTITAILTDANGQRGSTSVAVVVTRSIPGATLISTPANPAVGASVTFTVGATAAAGAPAITSVQVVNVATGQVVFSGTSGGIFVRSFGAPGVYVFEATVTDRSGSVGRASTSVNVVP
jgi:adhesin/invasin